MKDRINRVGHIAHLRTCAPVVSIYVVLFCLFYMIVHCCALELEYYLLYITAENLQREIHKSTDYIYSILMIIDLSADISL